MAQRKIITSLEQRPHLKGYLDTIVCSFERGLDPWHVDAFPKELQEQIYVRDVPRKEGWFGLDHWGNEVIWIPDGTEMIVPDVGEEK